jgi:MFS family permease
MPYIIGNALLALLPVYAAQLGANEIMTGIFLSVAFGALAIGSLISGWLSDRFQRRKLMIILMGGLAVPATHLMGQVNTVAALTVCMMIVWFAGGVTSALVNILTAMRAAPHERGRIFGIIGITLGLAQVIGGYASGAIVNRWGYAALFTLAAVPWFIQILAALFLEDPRTPRAEADQPQPPAPPLSAAVWLLIVANVLSATVGFSLGLGRPLMMSGLGFNTQDISNTVAIGGFVLIPLPFVVGWLSDRIGRKQLLMVSYLTATASALTLISAASIGQFWLSSNLLSLGGAGLSLGLAYMTDISPKEALATALSRFSASPWIAGVIGFGATGFVIQRLGLTGAFVIVAVLPLLAIVMIGLIRKERQPQIAESL